MNHYPEDTKSLRPADLPTCEHGRVKLENCKACQLELMLTRHKLQPLADEFWNSRGACSVERLLERAYNMGKNGDIK